jgi:hypothetical protein
MGYGLSRIGREAKGLPAETVALSGGILGHADQSAEAPDSAGKILRGLWQRMAACASLIFYVLVLN